MAGEIRISTTVRYASVFKISVSGTLCGCDFVVVLLLDGFYIV